MRFLILLTLASAASCDKLSKPLRLPAHAAAAGGAGAGLQAPFAGLPPARNYAAKQSTAQNYAAQRSADRAQILRYDNEINDEGYRYAYETSDGTKAEQNGRVIPGATPEEGSLRVSGSYFYIGDDGQTYTVTYTADESGYRAQGAHLPTPPPVPADILRSLQLTAGSGANYDSKKSSYDADAGY